MESYSQPAWPAAGRGDIPDPQKQMEHSRRPDNQAGNDQDVVIPVHQKQRRQRKQKPGQPAAEHFRLDERAQVVGCQRHVRHHHKGAAGK
jgi:hypothetical protein